MNSFILTAKRWIEKTGAIGLISKTGRYGGTFAHKDIAFEFASWVSVEFKLYLITEFQRLKDDENNRLKLDWKLQRTLAKINYRIHTDAIKERLSRDLRTAFPEMKGFSRANLLYMRAFAEAWPDSSIVQQVIGQLPWGQIIRLIQMVERPRRPRLLHPRSTRPRLEPQYSGNPNPEPASPPSGQSPEQLRPHHATGGLRHGRPAIQRPLPLRFPWHRRSPPRGRGRAGPHGSYPEISHRAWLWFRLCRAASAARSRW